MGEVFMRVSWLPTALTVPLSRKDTFAEDYQKMRVKISLGKDALNVKLYKKGKEISRKMKDGVFTERLDVGEAIFIEVLG